jgi:hypothetical protein
MMSEQEKHSYWWCQNCKAEVNPRSVTYTERHDHCGHPVVAVDPAAPTPVNDELLEALKRAAVFIGSRCGCGDPEQCVTCQAYHEAANAVAKYETNATKGG